MSTDPSDSRQTERFAQLLTGNQRRIYMFILALLPHPSDAEEVLQETSMVLWRKFDQFQFGSDFLAWACQVGRFEVLKFCERRQRTPVWQQIPEAVLDELATTALQQMEDLERRRTALIECIEKLKSHDRDLIERRSRAGVTIGAIAAELGRPVWGLYKVYGRIHRDLFNCIERRLAQEGGE